MAIPFHIPPEEGKPLPSPEEWEAFLRGLELVDVFLTRVRASRAKMWKGPPYRVHEPARKPVFHLVDEHVFVLEETFSLRVSARGVRRLFSLTLEAGVVYRTAAPVEEKFFYHIFLFVHTPVIWPYFRRWVRDLSVEFGFREHPIHLPLIYIPQISSRQKD